MEPLPHPHSLQDLKAEYFSGSPGWPAHPSPPQPWLEAQSSILRHKPCSRAATQRWAAHTELSKQSHSGEVPGALWGTSCPFSFWTGFPQLSPTRAELAAHAVVEAPLEPRSLQGPGVPPAEQEDGEELSGQGQFNTHTHTACVVS